jgi:arginine deiminase
MIQSFGSRTKEYVVAKSKPNPEPAEGQVPAGDYTPVSDSDPNQVPIEERQHTKSVQEIANEVVAGYWGRGNVRRKRLKEAGYDVDAVNSEVARIFNR